MLPCVVNQAPPPTGRAGCKVTRRSPSISPQRASVADSTRDPCRAALRGLEATVINFLSGSARERCELRGWGTYGVLLGPGESGTRRRLPHEECCRHREGLQLLLRVTFITAINMHATHRHAGLRLMPGPKARVERMWPAGMTRLAEKQCIK